MGRLQEVVSTAMPDNHGSIILWYCKTRPPHPSFLVWSMDLDGGKNEEIEEGKCISQDLTLKLPPKSYVCASRGLERVSETAQ